MKYTISELQKKGWEVLIRELGYAEATRFILLYEKGIGNYTKERKEILKGLSLNKIKKEIQQLRKKYSK